MTVCADLSEQNSNPRTASSTNYSAFESIPVIDISPIFTDCEDAKRNMASEIRAACTDVGFFQIRHHGIEEAIIRDTFAAASRFFRKSLTEKMRNHVSLSRNIRGYAAMLEENTDPNSKGDLHESFDIALELGADDPDIQRGGVLYGPNQWPAEDDDFQHALSACYDAMLGLSRSLLRCFALALNLSEQHFDAYVTKPLATMRILHYPPQSGVISEDQIGIGAHSDYECFTILAQDDIPALQVRNSEGRWIHVTPVPGCLVVNIGDQMARWTNDLFKSTVHRVINTSGKERYSIPFFFGPNYDTVVEVLPACVSAERPARYPPIKSGDYIGSRFADTFAHYKALQGPGPSDA